MWIVYALLASVVWGLDYVLAEKIFQSRISPQTLLALQMLVGAIIFLSLAYFTTLRGDALILASDNRACWLTVAALIGFAVANLLIAMSIKAKNAALAGLIEISYPIFIAFFS